jgi:DNA-binding transcriptional ArsR family regulator
MTLCNEAAAEPGRRSVDVFNVATPSGIGHDEAMAARIYPLHPLPPPIQDALEAVKAPTRVQIAHHLASNPRSRMGDIVKQIGGERHAIQAHLSAMEKVGLVVVSIPGEATTSTRWREYTLNQSRWTELVIRLINYLPSDHGLAQGNVEATSDEQAQVSPTA